MPTQRGIPPPDKITPQSPPESPPDAPPSEAPIREPTEVEPIDPDRDVPAPDFPETPPPPD